MLINLNSELIKLIIQSIKNDISSCNPVYVNLALQCISNIGSKEMCEAFARDLPKLLTSGYIIFIFLSVIMALFLGIPLILLSKVRRYAYWSCSEHPMTFCKTASTPCESLICWMILTWFAFLFPLLYAKFFTYVFAYCRFNFLKCTVGQLIFKKDKYH